MKVVRVDGERSVVRVLAGLTQSTRVLQKVASSFGDGPFASTPANTLARLAVKHLQAYHEAPGWKNLHEACWQWAEKHSEDSVRAALEQLLEAVAREIEEQRDSFNEGLLCDLAGEVFQEVALKRKHEQIGQRLEQGEIKEAEAELLAYRRVNVGKESGVHLFTDPHAWDALFNQQRDDVLVEYTSGLKDFFADSLARDCFVSFIAPSGVGKTWFLIDLAWRSLLQRRKTVFIAVGDMTEEQIKRRFAMRALRRPWKLRSVRYPVALTATDAQHEERAKEAIDRAALAQECERVMGKWVRSTHSHFYLTARPARSLSVTDIRFLLDELEHSDDFRADVVVIDYADMLAPESSSRKDDRRDQINETWTQLSALRMERHCLVVTATQANRQGFSAKLLRREHSSDDRRKLDHVTGMIGINQNDEEQALGLYQLNWIKAREMEFQTAKCCRVASCLAIGNPAVLSCYGEKEVVVAAKFSRNGHSGKE